MKTDEEFAAAVTRAHLQEEAFADFLRSCGLTVVTLSRGFRACLTDIVDYSHDVDLNIEGCLCQYKHRGLWLSAFSGDGQPFVDEVIKADRTPVDFYILRFCDGIVVVPYSPVTWQVQKAWDRKDRACKLFYTVSLSECIPLEEWVMSFLEDCPMTVSLEPLYLQRCTTYRKALG